MRAVTIKQFITEEDSVEWLVDSLLPDVGWTLLVGMQGLGKSTFAMQLCSAMQQAVPFLGRDTQQRDILYIQADSPTVEWREMLRRIAPQSTGYTVVDVPSRCLDNAAYVEQLAFLVSKVKPGYIVFDSLYNLTGKSLNTESVLLPVNMMKALAGSIPWLLIHHPPHGETRASGHNSLGANCSNEWHLTKNKLSIAKGRLVKDKEILLSRDKDGLWIMKSGSSTATSNNGRTFDDILNSPLI